MFNWMRTNGKYLMAFFGVLLMLVYILPSASKYGSGGNDAVHGHMGKLSIHQSDIQRYRNEWEFLNRYAYTLQDVGPAEAGMPPDRELAPIGHVLGPMAYEQIRQHSDMYPLLVEEARQMGAGVSRDQIESVLQNEVHTPDESGDKLIKVSELTDPDRIEELRGVLADFLLVQNAFDRAASTIKASAPLTQYMVATERQGISLNMVEFLASPYAAKVADPTPEQMQKQFAKYADIDASAADLGGDPFDFGYRYPNRIKLQYISVPRSAVMAAALQIRNQNDQTRYDWDVAAYRYYQAHQELYAATQPTNALALAPTTQKSIRPFKEISDEARQGVLQDDTDKLAMSIRQRITSQLATDYLTWKNTSTATTQPAAAAPMTSLGAAYNSPEYLDRLALMIQKNYGVLPTVVSVGNWQTAGTLDSLGGISTATIDDPDMPAVPFPVYAIREYTDFLPSDSPDANNALSLYEPSAALKSDEEDFYTFRITAAQASHAPANLAEVADQVRSDIKSKEAYDMADAAAQKYLAAARAAHTISAPAGKTVIVAGPINYDQTDPVIGYATLSPLGLRQFIRSAFDLLSLATVANTHPIGLIPVQVQARVLVGQISNIQALWPAEEALPVLQAAAGINLRQQLAGELRSQWFNYSDLVARTHYVEQPTTGLPSIPSGQAPNAPPLNPPL